ncbi:SIMPL domain-containing protein [Oceanobacillus sp. FSL K6-2867]|uniref:SIMPL domain-containing protein n=1 Tax=Oceanobacillus sp. FSL K6-2867 TaxID=2954748 RepID=UPI0030DA3444
MYYSYVPPYRQSFSRQQDRLLTVSGHGRVSIEPDIATIQLAVITEDESLSKAQQENAQLMNQVIQSLIDLGVPRENISTTSYQISPRYDFVDGQQLLRGYEVTNQISVRITPISEVGTVIDTAVQNGVNRVTAIQFSVDNRETYYQQALVRALENAQAKAQTIAESLQVNLDSTPIKITEEFSETPAAFKTMAVSAESFSTPIEPGEISIQAIVKAQFHY